MVFSQSSMKHSNMESFSIPSLHHRSPVRWCLSMLKRKPINKNRLFTNIKFQWLSYEWRLQKMNIQQRFKSPITTFHMVVGPWDNHYLPTSLSISTELFANPPN